MAFDPDKFREVADRIKAEQYLQEKFGEARVDPVAQVLLARASEVEDPELLKIAAHYCPEAPLEFYEERLGGGFKTATGWAGTLRQLKALSGKETS